MLLSRSNYGVTCENLEDPIFRSTWKNLNRKKEYVLREIPRYGQITGSSL